LPTFLALPGKITQNHIFSLRPCITVLPDIQQVAGLISSVLLFEIHADV